MAWANEDRYDGIVASAGARYNVPASLIKAVIAAESGFKPEAERKETRASDWPPGITEDASRGLMQLLEWRARTLGYQGSAEGLFDPYTNIDLGSKLLSINAARLGSWEAAISAYNGGIRPELGFGAPRADGDFAN
ncbi:MAG: transglycosylase SLT domain-containing protein, partial [Acidobacteriota bacterium]